MELLTIGNNTAKITALKADATSAEIGAIRIGKENPLEFSLLKLGVKKKKGSLQGKLQQPTGLGKKIGQDRQAFAQLNQGAREKFALAQDTEPVTHEPLQEGNRGVVFQQPIEGTKAQALQDANPFKNDTSEPRESIERHEPIEDHGGGDSGGGE